MTIDEFKEKIAPYMKKGWIAMDKNGIWYFYESKPKPNLNKKYWEIPYEYEDDDVFPLQTLFDITPVDNWKESLTEVGK